MKKETFDNKEYKMKTLKLALYLGELLMKNGAETYRVEDSVIRICKSRGYNYINCFSTPTVIIISDDRFDGLCFMKTINSRGINLNRISLLNNFSRNFVNKSNPDIDEEIKELHEIEKSPVYPIWFYYLATGFGSACFAAILGGNEFSTFIYALIITIIGAFIYDKTIKFSAIPIFSGALSSFCIATLAVLLAFAKLVDTPMMIIVGAIMPLLPGLSFVKSMRDLISGNLISGTARLFEVLMILVGLASGVGIVLDIYYRVGGGVF